MSKKITITALFASFAIILSYIETLIPVIGIPGVKLGLANLAILISIYLLGGREAIIINCVRIVLVGFMFTNVFSILYSIAGAIFSFIVMMIAKRMNLSMITVGILGGVFHNIGQLIIASFVVETYSVFSYVPILIISGIVTGALIGILSFMINSRVSKYVLKFIRSNL